MAKPQTILEGRYDRILYPLIDKNRQILDYYLRYGNDLKAVGASGNVEELEECFTRLRALGKLEPEWFTLADFDQLKKRLKVKGL